jgi:hypothetical protein
MQRNYILSDFHFLRKKPKFFVLVTVTVPYSFPENISLCEGEQGTGNREQGTGNREQGTGNREQGTGNREQGTGNREQGAGSREQGIKQDFS